MRLFRAVILLIAAAIVVFPAGVALAYPPANPVRALPDTVERGETFNVAVNFTAPVDDFTAISVTDFAPAGWNVTVNVAWCQPRASYGKATDNMAELAWNGPYVNGTNFTALYKVTVPCGASLENYTFYDYDQGLKYHIGNSSRIDEDITDDFFNVTVVKPAICPHPSIDFYTAYNETPPNQTLKVWSSTPCVLNWSLSDDAAWLNETPTNGSCTDVHSPVNLSVNISGMPLGDYPANITIESPEANNSPHIVPVTLHITVTGVLEGHVNFTGRGTPPETMPGCLLYDRWIERFEVKLFEPGNLTNVLWAGNATTDDTAVFTIPGLTPGLYDIGIKNCTCLSELVTNVTIDIGAPTEVYFSTIREGDAQESDKVDGFDFALLSSAYNTRSGDGNWNANADFDRSGKVDGFDFAMLSSNYNLRGDGYGYF
jgi:hypothetical protein